MELAAVLPAVRGHVPARLRGRAGLGGEVHTLHGGFGLRAARDEDARREGGGDVPEFQRFHSDFPFSLVWFFAVSSLESPTSVHVKRSISVESAKTEGRFFECFVIDET